jgi:hypothetical protein
VTVIHDAAARAAAWDWAVIGAWVLKFLGIVLAPIFGVIGALVGASVAGREARLRWTADRDEARRNAARTEALEVAAALMARENPAPSGRRSAPRSGYAPRA